MTKEHPCAPCGKSFLYVSDLAKHKRTSTGDLQVIYTPFNDNDQDDQDDKDDKDDEDDEDGEDNEDDEDDEDD